MTFDLFWQKYPRKVSRGAAEKSYLKAIKICSHDEIVEGLERFLEHLDNEPTERKFIPHGSTFLNGQRWADEYAPKRREKILTPENNSVRLSNLQAEIADMEKKEAKYGFNLSREINAKRAQIQGLET